MCLFCDLGPITRADYDGLCVSCRAGVADGIYTIEGERGRRIVHTATAAAHPLGCEYPNWRDPFPYRPEVLPALWLDLDRAATVLAHLEDTGRVDNQNSQLVATLPQPIARAALVSERQGN